MEYDPSPPPHTANKHDPSIPPTNMIQATNISNGSKSHSLVHNHTPAGATNKITFGAVLMRLIMMTLRMMMMMMMQT